MRHANARPPVPGAARALAPLALALAVTLAGPRLVEAQRGLFPGGGGPQSVAPVAEKLFDAVVNISTSQAAKGPQGIPLPKVPKDSPFGDFFEEFFNKKGGRVPPSERKVSSLGSGFVIDGKDGIVVTNNHVIEGADEIVVNFHDGSKLKVEKVLGKDSKTDLAVLKVSPKKPLPEVAFGSSAKMRVGDWVMAIGNPFGLGGSLTVGVISAKQRDINSGPYDDFLQTDAAINKGNSGGPLFNMDGEVIGVNTAIISPTGGSIGIGFAVPSDTALNVVDQLRQYGETRRGWLGVKIQTITEDIAETLGVKENSGALVSAVTPDSPAAKGGLEAGDVIMKFDGKDVTTMRGLPKIVAQTPIGKAVDVDILRRGEKKSFKVAVGRLTEDDEKPDLPQPKPAEQKAPEQKLMGLTLSVIDDQVRQRFGLDGKVKGVIVIEADPESPAAQKGIKSGDIIVEAGQDPVNSPDDLGRSVEKIRKAGRKAVLLRVEDGKGDLRFIAVPLS